MAAKRTVLTHKIEIQLHLVAESYTISSSCSSGQSGKFRIHPRICKELLSWSRIHLLP